MFGRSARALALAALALAPLPTLARTQSFTSGTPLGLGIAGGLENRPKSDFAAGTQTTASHYASYVAAEPFYDLGNFCFRLHFGWHFYPHLSGGSNDAHGTFTEGSDGGSFEYGARIELAPFISKNARQRFYFLGGLNESIVRLQNRRKYTSGALANTTYSDQVQGSGTEVNFGAGYEMFLIQNWSIAFEAGFRRMSAGSFGYRTTTDLTGAAVSAGDEAKDTAGNTLTFHTTTPYGQIVLNLNL